MKTISMACNKIAQTIHTGWNGIEVTKLNQMQLKTKIKQKRKQKRTHNQGKKWNEKNTKI